MYVAVLLILASWAVLFQARLLAAYALLVAIAFHLRVVFGEEPWLARMHGDDWLRYRALVSRWLGVRHRT
jgi:protein-S-isoprenylcysteine O-methyltransferase Ste14